MAREKRRSKLGIKSPPKKKYEEIFSSRKELRKSINKDLDKMVREGKAKDKIFDKAFPKQKKKREEDLKKRYQGYLQKKRREALRILKENPKEHG